MFRGITGLEKAPQRYALLVKNQNYDQIFIKQAEDKANKKELILFVRDAVPKWIKKEIELLIIEVNTTKRIIEKRISW